MYSKTSPIFYFFKDILQRKANLNTKVLSRHAITEVSTCIQIDIKFNDEFTSKKKKNAMNP